MAIFPAVKNAEELNTLIKKLSDITTKISVQELIDIYQDNWDYIIERELAHQFSLDTFYELYPLITKELNLIKRYVHETAIVYKKPAERVAFTPVKTKDDADNVVEDMQIDEVYEEAIKESNMNLVMKQVNRMTKLGNHSLLKIGWKNGKFDFDVLLFNNADILTDPDDWKRIVAVKFYSGLQLPALDDVPLRTETSDTTSQLERFFASRSKTEGVQVEDYETAWLYTLEDWKQVDEVTNISTFYKKGFIYKFEQLPDGNDRLLEKIENPYKDKDGNTILPFVKFDNQLPFDSPLNFSSGSDLVDLTLNVAMWYIHLNELQKFQSYVQPYMLVGDKNDLPDRVKANARTVWKMGNPDGNSSIGTLDLQSRLLEQFDVLTKRVEMGLAQYGIGAENFLQSGNPESGFHLFLKNRKLFEGRQDDIEIYRVREKECFEKMRIIHNYHNPTNLINVEAKFKIDFGDLEYPRSPQEIAQEKTVKINQNVETPVDWIMENDPDLTREEATKQWEENKVINQGNKGVEIQPAEQPGNGENR